MSAIAAVYRLDRSPVEYEDVQGMLDRLDHRGTDEQGVHVEKNIGLGHRMRWTTPESVGEKLPLRHAESSFVITCDARIDNRDDLAADLLSSNESIAGMPDSEIVLRAYEKWGEGCAEKLLGDFVFAIWNPREQKLFCARDSMGVKHFYYYYEPDSLFAIASEVKALFAMRGIRKELNETNIGDILLLNHHDKEITPYKGIKRLPANSAMTVSAGGMKIWQYWKPAATAKRRFRSSGDYEEEFRDIFTKAVTCRLRSIRPAGSMLSGGLDSSSISCIASRFLEDEGEAPLETFSAVFPSIAKVDQRIDERKFIGSVVRRITCHANYIEADAESPFLDIDRIHWHADHPIAAPNVFMDWALFKAAQSRNVGVLLSGFDGDSTVSYGYEAFRSLARSGRWFSLVRDAAALNKNMPARHHRFKELVWKQGFAAATPEFARQMWRLAHGRPRRLENATALPASMNYHYESMNAGFAAEQALKDRYFDTVARSYPEDVSLPEAHWNSLCGGIFAFALESFEKLAAAFEVDMRFPFFDRRLIEFCLTLPASEKVRKGWTRSILRRAMGDVLPQEVRWRTDKANIGLSYKVNMFKYGSEKVEEELFQQTDVLEKFIDRPTLAAAYERYKTDPIKHAREAMFIISAVYVSSWLRQAFGTRSH